MVTSLKQILRKCFGAILCLGWIGLLLLNACSQPGTTPALLVKPDMPAAGMQSSLLASPTETTSPEPTATQTGLPAPTAYFTPTRMPIKASPSLTPTRVIQVCTPLESHTLQDLKEIITYPFDPPPVGKDTGHHGIDFAYYRRGERASISGVTIQSALPGKVALVARGLPPYGNMLIVETAFSDLPEKLVSDLEIPSGRSIYLLYAHMNKPPLPQPGEKVACGQALGEVGNTPPGWSSDPHLHFEGRIGPAEVVFNGMGFYDTRANQEEMDNYRQWRMSGEFQLFDPMVLLNDGLLP